MNSPTSSSIRGWATPSLCWAPSSASDAPGAHPDYPSVFWPATGLAVIVLLAVLTLVPSARHAIGGRPDILGALTRAATLVLLLLPITQGYECGWSSPTTIGCFAGAAATAAVRGLVGIGSRCAVWVADGLRARPADAPGPSLADSRIGKRRTESTAGDVLLARPVPAAHERHPIGR